MSTTSTPSQEDENEAKVTLASTPDDRCLKSSVPSSSDPLLKSSQLHSKPSDNHGSKSILPKIESKIWITALILPLGPIAGFAIWLPFNGRYIGLEPRVIGGNLSQVEAKVIDFFCSVVIAPCIVTVFDYLWFSYARVLTVNEVIPKGGIPIDALASASSTDSGSFDLFKIWGLMRTGKLALYLLSLMILLSGSTKSLLSNVIAYEASTIVSGKTVPVNLQSLAASQPFWTGTASHGGAFDNYNFTIQQQTNFSSQFLTMLTDLTFHSAVPQLEDKYYVGTNVTTASLNALPSSVGSLTDVPGYRLSIQCQADTPSRLSISEPLVTGDVQIDAWFGDDPENDPNATAFLYRGGFTGGVQGALGVGVSGEISPYAAFSGDPRTNSKLFLGFLSTLNPWGSYDGQNNTQPSSYGDLRWIMTNQSMISGIAPNAPTTIFTWGILCQIARQTGFHAVERTETGLWKRVLRFGQYDEHVDFPDLRISDWTYDVKFHAPVSSRDFPGYGPAFTTTAANCSSWPRCVAGRIDGASASSEYFSFETMALNALYAIGETDRMLQEIGMENTTSNTFQVNGALLEQQYHITYVPLLVFFSLLSCLCACLITFGLLVFHRCKKTRSLRTWRKVTVTRLLVDALDGLRDDSTIDAVARRDNAALRDWSKHYDVQYVQDCDDSGVMIKLKKV
jgi:hypothetical protein